MLSPSQPKAHYAASIQSRCGLVMLNCPFLLTQQHADLLVCCSAQIDKRPIQSEAGCEAMQIGCLQGPSTAAAGGVRGNCRGGGVWGEAM